MPGFERCRLSGPVGSICRSLSPGLITGKRRLVYLVDLIGIEELFRVPQIDFLAHKDIEQIRIDMSVKFESAEDLQRFSERLAFTCRLFGDLCG